MIPLLGLFMSALSTACLRLLVAVLSGVVMPVNNCLLDLVKGGVLSTKGESLHLAGDLLLECAYNLERLCFGLAPPACRTIF